MLAAAAPTSHFPLETVAIFVVVFVLSLIVDLVQHKGQHEVTVRNAAGWSVFWVALSLGFWGWIRYHHGPEWGSQFLTGYILEKTLSIDNLMVFIAIFKFFRIESGLQHRILYYGILGAIVFRLIFVSIGSGFLLWAGHWAELIFGIFVAYAGVGMLMAGGDDKDEDPDYENMGLVRFVKKLYPVFPKLVGDRFFVDRPTAEAVAAKDPSITLGAGIMKWITPAFVCLLVIEGSDVLFAFDSVPAVIAVTKEPLLVYTAMIFAILGLRSLYFILLVLTKYLAHLEKAVIVILFFIAAKMFTAFAAHWFPSLHDIITPTQSMFVVLGTLALGVVASLIWPAKAEDEGSEK